MSEQHLPKIQIARHPEIGFGVSLQSPQTFQMQHSMISNRSYMNPFVKNDKTSVLKLKSTKSQAILKQVPQWTSRPHLTNFSTIQNKNGHLTGRMTGFQLSAGLNHSMQFNKKFQELNSQQIKLFHKRKGQFTSYLQNHLQNIDFNGPILGDERSSEKKAQTKQKLLLKKLQQLQKTKAKYSSIKPNRSLSPLLQKTKIRRNRLQLNDSVHQSYQQKENVKQKMKEFELPKINRNQLEESLVQLKSNYKRFKNQSLTKSYFVSSLSSVKTADFDKSGLLSKTKFI